MVQKSPIDQRIELRKLGENYGSKKGKNKKKFLQTMFFFSQTSQSSNSLTITCTEGLQINSHVCT